MRKLNFHNLFLMAYLFTFCFVVSHSLLAFRCLSDQSSALLQLKQEFVIQKPYFDDPYGVKNMDTWKASSDCCVWDGVTCNMSTGHVISLDLSNSGLHGPFHSNSSLFSLDHLQRLNLAYNSFNLPQIPSEFSQLSRLTHLNLSYSKFNGDIPLGISLLINLVSLDLSGNYLFSRLISMQILVQNMTYLRELHLDEVNFNSAVPESLANLTLLTSLSLSGCYLKGEFPKEIFRLPNLHAIDVSNNVDLVIFLPRTGFGSSLKLLDLSFTYFSGEIPNSIVSLKSLNIFIMSGLSLKTLPDSIGYLKTLKVLDLSFSGLSGIIPSWVGNLSQLTYLYLSYNTFNSSLPATLVNLSQLKDLDLSGNELSGEFPTLLGNLSELTYLRLSSNNFNGSLPFSLCNILAKLTVLELRDNQFGGEIPSSIGNLSRLTYVDLSRNLFHGNIPISLANLPQLFALDLSENKFACPIPTHIFENANSIVKLDLSKNSFIGIVPSSLFTMPSLGYLVMDDNQFTGPLSIKNISSSPLTLLSLNGNKLSGQIPRSISIFAKLRALRFKSNNLTGNFDFSIFPQLSSLDLSNNSLTGTLPKCFPSSLSGLYLRGNNFHGNIPETCTDECNLVALNLGRNQLQGKLPQSLTKCRELKTLDLAENQLQDAFPYFLQALPKLAVLILRSNKFHGPVWEPGKYWGFVDLRVYDVSSNYFAGNLPSDYFRNWSAVSGSMFVTEERHWDITAGYYWDFVSYFDGHVNLVVFKTIDLSNNRFYGEVPDSIGDISSLVVLNLSGNSFTSLIPLSLANLADLEALDLSGNKLTGRIPEQLTDLSFLEYLDLSHNQLMGPIPLGKQFSTFLNSSFEGNMGLCGFPTSNECENSEIPKVPESGDDLGWKFISRGYLCGLVTGLITGLIAGHIVISKKHNWFVETSAEYIRSHIGKSRN